MESLYYNLSEEEFTTGRKFLIWGFVIFFFLAGAYVLSSALLVRRVSFPPALSIAPFGISFIVAVIATFATVKRKDLYFSVDDDKIDFRYGMLRPKRHCFRWMDVKELIFPHRQKKAMLVFKDGSSYVIDLTWLQRKKAGRIRRHIYQAAWEKHLRIVKVLNLYKNSVITTPEKGRG